MEKQTAKVVISFDDLEIYISVQNEAVSNLHKRAECSSHIVQFYASTLRSILCIPVARAHLRQALIYSLCWMRVRWRRNGDIGIYHIAL